MPPLLGANQQPPPIFPLAMRLRDSFTTTSSILASFSVTHSKTQ